MQRARGVGYPVSPNIPVIPASLSNTVIPINTNTTPNTLGVRVINGVFRYLFTPDPYYFFNAANPAAVPLLDGSGLYNVLEFDMQCRQTQTGSCVPDLINMYIREDKQPSVGAGGDPIFASFQPEKSYILPTGLDPANSSFAPTSRVFRMYGVNFRYLVLEAVYNYGWVAASYPLNTGLGQTSGRLRLSYDSSLDQPRV